MQHGNFVKLSGARARGDWRFNYYYFTGIGGRYILILDRISEP
jgi:hypothetical protein